MDPCAFVRLTVDQLLLKLPSVPRPSSGAGVHPSTTPCFFTLHLQDHPSSLSRTAPLPLAGASSGTAAAHADPVVLSLDAAAVQRLSARPAELVVSVHAGRHHSGANCGMSAARALGRVRVAVDVARAAAGETVVARDGWVEVGKAAASGSSSSSSSASSAARAQIHMVVRAEPDPRYVFQFGGEPECGPVVYQVPGGGAGGGQRQPVFSCRFSAGRRITRTRSLTPQSSMTRSTSRRLRSWLSSTLHGDGQDSQARREQRKGWTVTIHDLSGSPVAAASMVTPFVPSPGSGRVSRANPGSWLILQATGAGPSSWKPWARLEAWRERGPVDALGYRLELVFDSGPTECTVPIAESSISTKRGGQFVIDPATFNEAAAGATWPFAGGFVMGSTVEGEGRASRPTVQVGVQHVTCMGDVAVFVALSAAVDLCMDACKLFSQRLRKELCQDQDE
ncbi:hypothetical protein PR202_ga09726 [Eleusine coracana subsp. coracana]|uniref:DUF1005 family protein n=1 Tax=Eleusine coracana subsp. coracana TaxID=191504 RepID=A0AAV5C548_ELECO|nr:hypothetical protein QOZ80_1AG0032580 [Eleusine coracana subsp. coracana]GJM93190.1 hypothetical protein PR202_ga09726 [Eleusine coracana subsp. coracana]